MSVSVLGGMPRVCAGLGYGRAMAGALRSRPAVSRAALAPVSSVVSLSQFASIRVASTRSVVPRLSSFRYRSLSTTPPRQPTETEPSTSTASTPPGVTPTTTKSTPTPTTRTEQQDQVELYESPYTIPNALTLVRIAACPYLAYAIVQGQYDVATGVLVASGFTDWLDGYLARRWKQKTVLGSIIDPMADKTLMTTLVVALTYKGLLPMPLAAIIIGRDLFLSLWAFYIRYQGLPPPRTITRYFDPSIPSSEVKPTQISKINTALQLLLMGVTTISPLITAPLMDTVLRGLQWTVAGTTIWSGLGYVFGRAGFRTVARKPKGPTTPSGPSQS